MQEKSDFSRPDPLNMIDEVGNTLGLQAIHLAENGTNYNGQGFVFGRLRPNGTWKFYAYGSASGVRKICELYRMTKE